MSSRESRRYDSHSNCPQSSRRISPWCNIGSFLLHSLHNSNANRIKRTRNVKQPVPDRLKDQAYFERRRRNNLAAKKWRDARKCRESQLDRQALSLQQENLVLRAVMHTMRRELAHLHYLIGSACLLNKSPLVTRAQQDVIASKQLAFLSTYVNDYSSFMKNENEPMDLVSPKMRNDSGVCTQNYDKLLAENLITNFAQLPIELYEHHEKLSSSSLNSFLAGYARPMTTAQRYWGNILPMSDMNWSVSSVREPGDTAQSANVN